MSYFLSDELVPIWLNLILSTTYIFFPFFLKFRQASVLSKYRKKFSSISFIVSIEEFHKQKPDIAILFAWNHKTEILEKEKNFSKEGGIWVSHVSD